jgi:hypothetical protein
MADLRKTFSQGRMNLDIDNRLLPDGDYREASNVVVMGNESNNEGSVRKSFSTKKITNLDLGENPICLGTFSYNARNRVYWLILSDVRACLIEHDFNNNVSSFILNDSRVSNRVFDLKKDFFCTAINIIPHEDIKKELFLMTDNNIEPLCINIERAKKYGENGFEKEDIYLIKKPPLKALLIELTYTGGLENYMEETFQLFFYRYKFLDGEYSAFSDFSNYPFAPGKFDLDYQTLENKGMINQFNAVKIFFNTGGKRVTDIQVLLKKTNSNAPYIIETFNKEKEQWADDIVRSFIFSNEKIYIALPEKELFRTFDNVPRKALCQTVIGNKVTFGNYVEGYDLLDSDFKKIKLNYLLSIISKDISGILVPKTINPTINTGSTTISVNLSGISLKKDTSIRFSLNMKSAYLSGATYTDEGDLDRVIDFVLNSDFSSVPELVSDLSFVAFIEDTLSNFLFSAISFTPPANGALDNTPKFSAIASGDNLIITAPIHIYKIDNTPSLPSDNDFTFRNYVWLFLNETEIFFRNFSTSSSIKTNRSYGVGVLYMDDFKRKTTVLTCVKNTIYIPQLYSVNKNSIKVSIDNPAPYWATSYKYVVKQQPLNYNIIYGVKFYEEGLFRWLKLEGTNVDKINKGDTLIVKSDLGGPVENPIKTLVLEKTTKPKDFIVGNLSSSGISIIEEEGTYIKVKPLGFDMNYNNATVMTFHGGQHERYPFRSITAPFMGVFDSSNVFVPFAINGGSQIRIYIKFEARGKIEYSAIFDERYVATESYPSIKAWFQAEVKNLGSFGQSYTWNGISDIGDKINAGFGAGNSWNEKSGWGWIGDSNFFVVPHRKGTATRNITSEVRFEVLFTEGLVILETEPKQIENELYYECSGTFDIVDGLHQGNVQNQTAFLPAIAELDFFNCYVQGNGAESYQIKDSVSKPFLNIDTKPTTTTIEEYKEIRRSADLTYSESFVESSNVNGLNVFNLSTGNFKDDLDKQYGSIQRIHSRENDIVVLQEDKAGKVLFGKDALFTSDGETALTGITEVLGRYIPYMGNRGIGQNPESFSIDDYSRIKYASVKNGTIVRLSNDGIEDISYGLKNFFRNLFLNNFKSKIISGYDAFLNLTFFTVGDEEQTVPIFNCGNQIIKAGQDDVFEYKLLLNNLSGDVVFNYNITQGVGTIQVVFDNLIEIVSNVSGSGTIVMPRNNLIETFVLITVTPVSETIDYSITNTCPLGTQLEIITVVLNDSSDETKSVTNQFKSNASSYISDNDIFTSGPVTRFERLTGLEGVGSFPANGDLVTIESLKESTNSGRFEIGNCNRLGYLISTTIYSSSQYELILSNPNTQFLTLAEIGETNFSSTVSGQFLFNRNSLNEKLYLIWDYTDRKPILADDSVGAFVSGSVIVDVLANDSVLASNVTLTIVTAPLHGTAVVNIDKTITYTHNGSNNFQDSIVYQVSNGNCNSTATINIGIGSPCNAAINATGGTGIYEVIVNIGTDTGITGINHESQGVPDRFEIFYDNIKVADSKYVGDYLEGNPPGYEGLLGLKTGFNIFNYNGTGFVNSGNIEPDFTVTQSDIANGTTEPTDGTGTITFNKTTATPTIMKIRVTGTSGTAWSFTSICPS